MRDLTWAEKVKSVVYEEEEACLRKALAEAKIELANLKMVLGIALQSLCDRVLLQGRVYES